MTRMVGRQAGAADPAFDAAALAAKALRRFREFRGAHAWQEIVAPFAGNAVRALQNLALDSDAAAHARAGDNTEHDAYARAGAICRL